MKRTIALVVFLSLLITIVLAGRCHAARYPAERNELHKCVVRVTCGSSAGTGTVFNFVVEGVNRKFIATALHVVGSAKEAKLSDGTKTITAEIVGVDRGHDIAIMMARDLDTLDIVAAPLLTRRAIVGEAVQHCGYGGGKLQATKGRVTSASGRLRCTGEGIGGDSGSPIFIDGAVAGILTNRTTYRVPVGRNIFGGIRYSKPQPAFIGTSSIVVMAIMYAKPMLEKIIKVFRAWRAYRQDAFPIFPDARWNRNRLPKPEPKPDIVITPPPIPDEAAPPLPEKIAPITAPPPGQAPPPVQVEVTASLSWDWIFVGPIGGFFLFGTAAIILILLTNSYRKELS